MGDYGYLQQLELFFKVSEQGKMSLTFDGQKWNCLLTIKYPNGNEVVGSGSQSSFEDTIAEVLNDLKYNIRIFQESDPCICGHFEGLHHYFGDMHKVDMPGRYCTMCRNCVEYQSEEEAKAKRLALYLRPSAFKDAALGLVDPDYKNPLVEVDKEDGPPLLRHRFIPVPMGNFLVCGNSSETGDGPCYLTRSAHVAKEEEEYIPWLNGNKIRLRDGSTVVLIHGMCTCGHEWSDHHLTPPPSDGELTLVGVCDWVKDADQDRAAGIDPVGDCGCRGFVEAP